MTRQRRKRRTSRVTKHKDTRKLVRASVQAGAEVVMKGKHPALLLPDGTEVPFSGTPSDINAHRQTERKLKSHGFVPGKKDKMARGTPYNIVNWPEQDLERMKQVLRDLGYDRDKSRGTGRGGKHAGMRSGGLTLLAEHALKLAEENPERFSNVWPTANAGAKAIQYAWDIGRSNDWTHDLLMNAVADLESVAELKAATPPAETTEETVEKIGPLYGDGQEIFACPECGKEFASKAGVGRHRSHKHGYVSQDRYAVMRRKHKEPEQQSDPKPPEEIWDELLTKPEEAEEVANEEYSPVPMQVITGTPIPASSNGYKPLTKDALHLRILMALVSPEAMPVEEAMAIAAEIANLELGIR